MSGERDTGRKVKRDALGHVGNEVLDDIHCAMRDKHVSLPRLQRKHKRDGESHAL